MHTTSFFETLSSCNALLAMWAALILHWLFSFENSHYHPLTLWFHTAQSINEKANHRHYSVEQQQLSGTLAFLLMWLTAALLLISLKILIGQHVLFELVLLWLALGWKPLFQHGINLQTLLTRAKKPAARMLLAKIIKRDTTTLSGIDLTKASCETLLAGYARSLINVLFFYAIAGGIGALLYTLLTKLSREWSSRLFAYQHFGLSTARLLNLVEWLPSRIFAFFLSIGSGFHKAVHAARTQSYQTNSEFIWSVVGSKYHIALGGAATYDEEKIQRSKLGGDIPVCAADFTMLNNALLYKSLIWISLQSLIMLVVFI